MKSLKRTAKAAARQSGLPHKAALESVSRQAGFSNFTHARHGLVVEPTPGAAPAEPPGVYPERPGSMSDLGREGFLTACRDAWEQTFQVLAGDQEQVTWTGRPDILPVLKRILAHTRSHAHLPTGGGQDFGEVNISREPGVLEFQVERGLTYLARPARLIVQRLPQAHGQSFALLELDTLQPSGVYEPIEEGPLSRREELVEVGPREYLERSVWDQGFLDYDQSGYEIPLPEDARLLVRWFNGKILFVSKGSLWNGTSGTYDGRHDRMGTAGIQSVIEAWLKGAPRR
jgi:serine/threonine-protein kinase